MVVESDNADFLNQLRDTVLECTKIRQEAGEDISEDLLNIPELAVKPKPRPDGPIPGKIQFILSQLNKDEYKKLIRMNRDSFYVIFDLVKDREIYRKTSLADVKI